MFMTIRLSALMDIVFNDPDGSTEENMREVIDELINQANNELRFSKNPLSKKSWEAISDALEKVKGMIL